MSIQVTCHSCGKQLKAKEESAGKKVKCPGCGTILVIPEPVYDAVEDGYDDAEYEESYDDNPFAADNVGSYGAAVDAPSTKKKSCPMCGEMILAKAAKCRYCGEIFDAKLKKGSKKSGADDAEMTTGDWVVALLCSGIGCLAGIVWLIQGKPKGGKMLGVSLLMVVVWNIINLAIQAAAGR